MRCFVRIGLLLLLAGFASSGVGAAPAGIPNFHQVGPGIYRGGAPTREGLQTLARMGIHTIIDLRIERWAPQEGPVARAMGFTWIRLPMSAEAPTRQQVATFLATLAKAPGEPVYVHCQHGSDRTGCMIGIYRVSVQGWPFARAWAEMRRYEFNPRLGKLKEAVRARARS